jgi:hypothetical protein
VTRKQRSVALNAILVSIVACVLGALGYMIVTALQQPAQAQPNIPIVNTRGYEQVKTVNDGIIDHYCLGTTGIWFGSNSQQFAVEAGDPQCR